MAPYQRFALSLRSLAKALPFSTQSSLEPITCSFLHFSHPPSCQSPSSLLALLPDRRPLRSHPAQTGSLVATSTPQFSLSGLLVQRQSPNTVQGFSLPPLFVRGAQVKTEWRSWVPQSILSIPASSFHSFSMQPPIPPAPHPVAADVADTAGTQCNPPTPPMSLEGPASQGPAFSFDSRDPSWHLELMAVPKRKVSPSRKGKRNGPKALKPIGVIVKCHSCGRVKLPHIWCCAEGHQLRKYHEQTSSPWRGRIPPAPLESIKAQVNSKEDAAVQ